MIYTVPTDDTHFLTFMLWRSKFTGQRGRIEELCDGKPGGKMTDQDYPRSPGEYEAQPSIGALPEHNREHLSQGDVARLMRRR